MIGIAVLIGASIVLDPFLRYRYFFEEEPKLIKQLWRFPYILTALIILLPISLILVYKRMKTVSRLQWDLLLFFGLICTMFINFWGLIHFHVTFLILTIIFLLILFRGALNGKINIVILPIDVFYLIFMSFMVFSVYGPLGRPSITLTWTMQFFSGTFLPVFFIHNLIRTRKQLIKIVHYVMYVAMFSSVVGIIQFIAYKAAGVDISGNWFLEYGRHVNLPVIGDFIRVAGLSGNANGFGLSTGVVTVMMVYYYLNPSYFSRRWRRLLLFGIIIGLLASVFSASRGSWLSVGVCLSIIPFMTYTKYSRYILLAYFLFGAIGVLSGLFGYIYDAVYNLRYESSNYRKQLFIMGVEAVKDHPWTGVGFSSFESYWNFLDGTPHNIWLNFASQIGLLGTLVLAIYYASLVIRLIRAILHSKFFNRMILNSFLLGSIFFLITTMIRPGIWNKFWWLYFGIVETSLYLLGRLRERNKVYYPIFGYSWKDEPLIQIEER
jgi:O-antigen ligase